MSSIKFLEVTSIQFVTLAVNYSIHSNKFTRQRVGRLLVRLIERDFLSRDDYRGGLLAVVDDNKSMTSDRSRRVIAMLPEYVEEIVRPAVPVLGLFFLQLVVRRLPSPSSV